MKWIKLINRKNAQTGTNWQPEKDSRVCSIHFEEGNPLPTLNLGYNLTTPLKARPTPKARLFTPKVQKQVASDILETCEAEVKTESVPSDPVMQQEHSYSTKCACTDNCDCNGCQVKLAEIAKLNHQIELLNYKADTPLSVQCTGSFEHGVL